MANTQIVTRSGKSYGKYNKSETELETYIFGLGLKNHDFNPHKPEFNYKKLIEEYIKKEKQYKDKNNLPPPPKLLPSLNIWYWVDAIEKHKDIKKEFQVAVSYRKSTYYPLETTHILYHEPNKTDPEKHGKYWRIVKLDMNGKLEYFLKHFYNHF